MSIKSLFWKKVDLKAEQLAPKVEPGANLTYLNDRNKYLYFGGLNQKQQNQNNTNTSAVSQEKQDESQTSSKINFSIGKPSFNSFSSLGKKDQNGETGGGIKFSIGGATQSQSPQDFVFILDPAYYTWEEIPCKGKVPPKRINYFSWYEAPYFFIFGGQGQNNKTLNDMYFLNVDTFEWKRFFWLEGPPARMDCALINMGIKKYIIGGASMPENWILDDIWSFSLENVVWDTPSTDVPGIMWQKVQLEDNAFQPLKSFDAVKVSESQIFIFGGFNSKKQCTDTSILFDIDEEKIIEFETKGNKPGPRAYHKILPVKDNIICLFGGVSCPEDSIRGTTSLMLNDFYILNLREGYWNRPNTGGYIPSPRYHFGMACNQSELATEILLLGGKSTENLCDKYLYVLGEMVKDQEEYWGERNDQSKLGFEVYREALKNNKKKAQELKNVSITTLEFSQAEKVLDEQRRRIGELETKFKQLQQKNDDSRQEQIKFKQKIIKNRDELDKKNEGVREEIKEQNVKNTELKIFVGQIQQLLAHQRKKRKFLQLKSFQLQDTLRKAENLIITVDQVYNKGYKDELIEGVITEEAIKKIERKKADHKQQLSMFREDFDNIFNDEKKIKKEIQKRKKELGEDINVSKDWKRYLNPEEKRLFDSKGLK